MLTFLVLVLDFDTAENEPLGKFAARLELAGSDQGERSARLSEVCG